MTDDFSSEQRKRAWRLDQLAKSEFFRQKAHEWSLLSLVEAIEAGVPQETLLWDQLGISALAWQKIQLQQIKPVLAFAHPIVLTTIPKALGYYRMLAMVSQKSMQQVGLSVSVFEQSQRLPSPTQALSFAHHLNPIISSLIEAESNFSVHHLLVWRAMAAGTQAQGSWQNLKGARIEQLIQQRLLEYLKDHQLLHEAQTINGPISLSLPDERLIVFGKEPDITVYHQGQLQSVVEIKGGIDAAGALERFGAAIKSLSRAKHERPETVTILIVSASMLTQKFMDDWREHQQFIDQLMTVEDILGDAQVFRTFLGHMGI